jgi:MYXO-CTERM domain-containing protein
VGGSGTVGALTVDGILAPGSGSVATLNAGTTTWNGGDNTAATLWQFDLSPTSNVSDTLAITGNFKNNSPTGTYKFDFMNSAPTSWGNVYTLLTWTGTTDFTDVSQFSWTNLGGTFDSQPGTGFTLNANSLTFTAVPEPTSALIGLVGVAGLLRRRR